MTTGSTLATWVGFVALAGAALGCSSSGSDDDSESSDPTAGRGCALVIHLSGEASISSKASDPVSCATSVEPPPGVLVTYAPPLGASVEELVLDVPDVAPGALAMGLRTSWAVALPDGSSSRMDDCTVDLAENRLLGSDAYGVHYLVRGTGSCLNMSGGTVDIDGSFSFATNAFWSQ
jgi:hypothetical protein